MSEIQLTLKTDDKETLRITASYLLALAGDITPTITAVNNDTFTAAELAEAERLGKYDANGDPHPDGRRGPEGMQQPDPAKVFGGNGAGEVAPSTVAAVPPATAPEAVPAISATPAVPVPPAATPENAAPPVVPQPTAPAPGVEVDARGLPWDPRIHSRTKSKKADGNWKNARGVDENLVKQVEQELRALMAIPAPVTEVPTPPLDPVATVAAPVATPSVPQPPVTTATTANPSSEAATFPSLMQKVAAALAANQLTQTEVLEVAQANGVAALPLLVQRPDLVPQVDKAIDAKLAAKGFNRG